MKSITESNPELQELWQLWFILKRRWRPAAAVFGSVIGLTALITFSQKPVYWAEGQLQLESRSSTSSLTESGKEMGERDNLGLGDPLDTEAKVISSIPIVEKTIAALNLKDKQGKTLEPENFIDKGLKVSKIKGTVILQVLYKSTNPAEAAAVVNQLMNLYLENGVLTERAKAVTALEFITKQLPKTEATVRQAESALRNFKEENNIVNLEEEEQSVAEVITDLESQMTKAEAQLAVAAARAEVLRNKLGMNTNQAVTSSSLSQSPSVQKALEEFQEVQGQLAIEQTRFQEANPVIADLKEREAALKTVLQGRVGQVIQGRTQTPNGNLQIADLKQGFTAALVSSEAERLGFAREVSTLSNVLANYKQRANDLPRLQQQERQLERQIGAAQSTYEGLLKKLQEIRVVENQAASNAHILAAARVPKKFSLRPIATNLGLGVLLGTLLSVATIFVLEVRDKSIKTVKEVRELFELTLLGVIPFFGKLEKNSPYDKALIVRDAPCSYISESYRMLQSNLKFLSSEAALKVIVVTSSIVGEGKSTVSANLAVTMAERGRRVLLIDADMRRPIQHHIWQLSNAVGLSNVLAEQTSVGVAKKEVLDNLDVLPAGATPPNPGSLLDSRRMDLLVKSFSNNYDVVVIDTPCLNVADDPRILGKLADGILLVVRPGVVDSDSATSSKEMLNQLDGKTLGLVVNGVKPKDEPYNYYAKEYYDEADDTTFEKSQAKVTRNANLS